VQDLFLMYGQLLKPQTIQINLAYHRHNDWHQWLYCIDSYEAFNIPGLLLHFNTKLNQFASCPIILHPLHYTRWPMPIISTLVCNSNPVGRAYICHVTLVWCKFQLLCCRHGYHPGCGDQLPYGDASCMSTQSTDISPTICWSFPAWTMFRIAMMSFS
jgi:hypothetical protein